MKVMLLEVVSDLFAEHRSLHIGGAEVDAPAAQSLLE
jgi:hypothetical protein